MKVFISTGKDFSISSHYVTFPETKQVENEDRDIFIAISDDNINEGDEVFVVIMELLDAVDPTRVDLSACYATLCMIGDNDRKLTNTLFKCCPQVWNIYKNHPRI